MCCIISRERERERDKERGGYGTWVFYYLCVHNEGVFVCGIDLYLYEKIDCRNGKVNANGIEEEHINQNRF